MADKNKYRTRRTSKENERFHKKMDKKVKDELHRKKIEREINKDR